MKRSIFCGVVLALAAAALMGQNRPGRPGRPPGPGQPPAQPPPVQPPPVQPPQPPATIPAAILELRQEKVIDKQRSEVSYKFQDDFVSLVDRAAQRGKAAAEAWAAVDKTLTPVAVVARSPWGGGETSATYWPADMDPKLLTGLAGPLAKAGIRAVFPDFPDAPTSMPTSSYATLEEAMAARAAAELTTQTSANKPKPFPAAGFPDPKDYQFVLVVGLHHELNPHGGKRLADDGKSIYFRRSRVSAWAILFHVPSATAFWATASSAKADYVGIADPPGQAAAEALGNLDLSDLGKDNIPGVIGTFAGTSELAAIDLAACLCQTQRGDAVAAVVKMCKSDAAYKQSAPVLRYFNEKGTPQDYRLSKADAEGKGLSLIDQGVTMHLLLMEQLRGVRSFEGAMVMASTPMVEDLDIRPLGKSQLAASPLWTADDELVLLSELAVEDNRDPAKTLFDKNWAGALQNLGKCKTRVDEAIEVAKYYVRRKMPMNPRPGPPPADPLRPAAQAALDELQKTKAAMSAGPTPGAKPSPATPPAPAPASPGGDKPNPAPTTQDPWKNLID